MIPWSVVQCEAQREHITRLLIMRHGYATYCPRIKIHGRIQFLFPTYVFVSIHNGRWYPIRWTPHVLKLLMAGEQPAILPEPLIGAIQAQERGGFVKLPSNSKILKKGDNVRISSGSFLGHVGLVDGASRDDRIRVLLDLLGRKVSVDLPQISVTPLDVVAR